MKKRNGSAILFALIIMVVGSTTIIAILGLIQSDMARTKMLRDNYIDTYMAESGINATIKYIGGNTAEFIAAYEGDGNELSFSIDFPNVKEKCNIIIKPSETHVSAGNNIIEIHANYGVADKYYIMSRSGNGILFIKYVDR
ncbi:MAG: hypothetical protein ACK5LT_12210 [Lachnospirales bacterium]